MASRLTVNTRPAQYAPKSGEEMDKEGRTGRWLVLWSFDDVILKPGTALGEQPIGQHFSRPLDG